MEYLINERCLQITSVIGYGRNLQWAHLEKRNAIFYRITEQLLVQNYYNEKKFVLSRIFLVYPRRS